MRRKKLISIISIVLCLFQNKSFSQIVNGKLLKDYGYDAGIGNLRMVLPHTATKIVDGVIYREMNVPLNQVENAWTIKDSTEIRKIMQNYADSVQITNTKNSALEQFIYDKAGIPTELRPYKLPIILNESFFGWYALRKKNLMYVKPEEIRKIVFLTKDMARNKYGSSILFGAVEIYKD